MARVFKYGDNSYADPGAEFSIDDVRVHLTQFFPELAQATHSEKTLDDGTVEVTFAKKVGTKGALPHRYRVDGEFVYIDDDGHEHVDDLVLVVESALGPEDAAREALAQFFERTGTTGYWQEDMPPDVEDLGEVPMDVLMRRQGQPMLFELAL